MDPLVLKKRDYEISLVYGGSVYNTKCILYLFTCSSGFILVLV